MIPVSSTSFGHLFCPSSGTLECDVGGRRPATSSVHYTTRCNTQSSVPEDGQNNCLKHDEETRIINKPLLLYLAGCLYFLYQ